MKNEARRVPKPYNMDVFFREYMPAHAYNALRSYDALFSEALRREDTRFLIWTLNEAATEHWASVPYPLDIHRPYPITPLTDINLLQDLESYEEIINSVNIDTVKYIFDSSYNDDIPDSLLSRPDICLIYDGKQVYNSRFAIELVKDLDSLLLDPILEYLRNKIINKADPMEIFFGIEPLNPYQQFDLLLDSPDPRELFNILYDNHLGNQIGLAEWLDSSRHVSGDLRKKVLLETLFFARDRMRV